MIQTDEQKVQFANIFYEEQDQIKEILSRHTKLIMTLSHFDTPPHWRRCLTLYNPYDNTGIESTEVIEHAMTFPFESDTDKIAFANWVVETELDRFRTDYMAVHVSTMHMTAQGVPVVEALPA